MGRVAALAMTKLWRQNTELLATLGRYQNTGMRESTSKPAIDQLNAMRARGLPRKRAIATPNPAHITTDIKHAPASTLAITEVCDSRSPPTVV